MAFGSGVIITTLSGESLLFFEGDSSRPACWPLPSTMERFSDMVYVPFLARAKDDATGRREGRGEGASGRSVKRYPVGKIDF